MGSLKIPSGTKAALDARIAASELVEGRMYYVTDEDRVYIATAVNVAKPLVSVPDFGAAGQVLTSAGAGADPTFQDAQSIKTVKSTVGTYTLVLSDAGLDLRLAGTQGVLTLPTGGDVPFASMTFVRVHSTHGTLVAPPSGGNLATRGGNPSRYITPGSSALLVKTSVESGNAWEMYNYSPVENSPYIAAAVFRENGTLPASDPSATLNMVESGDLIMVFTETAAQAISAPSGYTEAPNSPQTTGTAGSTTSTRLHVFYKVADGSETSVSVSRAADHTAMAVLTIKNVDPVNPFDVTAGAVATSSTAVSFPTVTPTRNNDLVISALAWATDVATAQFSGEVNGALKNLSEVIDDGTSNGNGGGLTILSGVKSAPGATGSTTGTLSTASVQARWTGAINAK